MLPYVYDPRTQNASPCIAIHSQYESACPALYVFVPQKEPSSIVHPNAIHRRASVFSSWSLHCPSARGVLVP